MSAATAAEPADSGGGPVLSLGDDPVAALESATWAMAALVGTLREALTAPLADVLAADPRRTAVLEQAGLVRRDGGGFAVHPALSPDDPATARSAVEARLSSLRQAVSAAAQDSAAESREAGWAGQPDEVLLHQGRASAATGRALGDRIVPRLAGLERRLGEPGSRILDVGTGVAALALALARRFPQAHVVGIDVLERALRLAGTELAAAEPAVAARVSLHRLDVAGLPQDAVYALAWLPAPFLSEEALEAALPRLASALTPGGWLVAGTNPAATDPLRQAVGRWTAVRNGGNSYDTARTAQTFAAHGLEDIRTFPTVPGGPVLVAGRRPPG